MSQPTCIVTFENRLKRSCTASHSMPPSSKSAFETVQAKHRRAAATLKLARALADKSRGMSTPEHVLADDDIDEPRFRSPPVSRVHARAPLAGTVVFVVPDFEPSVGGTTRQAGLQARAMLERGYDVVVLTRRFDSAWPEHEVLAGL